MESKITLLLLLLLTLSISFCVNSTRPDSVNVGALLSFNSVIGKAAKTAMEIAVIDVNKDSTILNATQFNLFMEDTNCSVFKTSIGGMFLLLLRLN